MAQKTDAALVQEYLEWMRDVRKRAPSSVYSYRRTLILWLRHIHPTPLVAVTVSNVDSFLARPREVGGRLHNDTVAPGTIKGELARVRSLYDWMVSRDYAYANPARKVDSPTVHNERPRPVADLDWRRLWFSALPDDERVAYGLGYFCGLRRHEICNLSPDQFVISPRTRIEDVRRKGGKRQSINWSSCVRFYATKRPDLIGDPLSFVGALERLLDTSSGRPRLMPWAERRYGPFAINVSRDTGIPAEHVLPDQLNKHLRRRLALLGVPAFTPHQLRHSFCTNLLAMGVGIVDVSRLAGHASTQMTLRYIETSEDPLGELLAQPSADHGIPLMGRWG